ncbi:MAG: hypothetical protein QXH59_08055, partial [Candidatus Caldarchaeum sp.]
IAEYADVFGGGMPWELLAVSDELVFNRRLVTYSDTAAARFRVDQLNLVLREQVSLVKTALNDFITRNIFPANVFTVGDKRYETLENAQTRYRALLNWVNTYNLAVVSNGPYILAAFDPASQFAELRAYRDPSYPFKPGKWFFGAVEKPRITRIQGSVVVGADSVVTVSVAGPDDTAMAYRVVDPVSGKTIASGRERAMDGKIEIRLPSTVTSTLTPGLLELGMVVYSDKVAQSFNVVERLEVRRTAATQTITTTPIATTTQRPTEQPSIPTWLVIAVVGVAVVVAAAFILTRRR